MNVFTLFAYYFLFWWVTLFAVLSIGLKTQEEAGEVIPGTEPSAPAKLRLWRRLLLNTVISGCLFAAWYYATEVLGYGISSIPSIYPQEFK
jgi:predicted secreted protein